MNLKNNLCPWDVRYLLETAATLWQAEAEGCEGDARFAVKELYTIALHTESEAICGRASAAIEAGAEETAFPSVRAEAHAAMLALDCPALRPHISAGD